MNLDSAGPVDRIERDPTEIAKCLPFGIGEPSKEETGAQVYGEEEPSEAFIADVLHGQMMSELSLTDSLSVNAKVLMHEIKSSERRVRKLGAAIVGLGVQVLDRARVMFLAVPNAATAVYEHTHNPGLAGLAAGATFFVWSGMVGETVNQSMRALPKSVESTSRSFPGLVNFFDEALPGSEARKNYDKKLGVFRKIGKVASCHLSRAMTGIGLGSTAYVATSVARGDSINDSRLVNLNVTGDTSGLIVGLGTGLTYTLDKLASTGHAETARWLNDWMIGNNYFWMGIAGLTIAGNVIASKFSDKSKLDYRTLRSRVMTSNSQVIDIEPIDVA